MRTTPNKVQVYSTRDGKIPFINWLDRLRDMKGKQIIRTRIARMELGNFGDSKSVGEGVSELRVPYGPGYRVYFGRDGVAIVVLLVGGDKKSQDSDIRLAKEFWKDYKERENETKR